MGMFAGRIWAVAARLRAAAGLRATAAAPSPTGQDLQQEHGGHVQHPLVQELARQDGLREWAVPLQAWLLLLGRSMRARDLVPQDYCWHMLDLWLQQEARRRGLRPREV